jgi:hypothetical protein
MSALPDGAPSRFASCAAREDYQGLAVETTAATPALPDRTCRRDSLLLAQGLPIGTTRVRSAEDGGTADQEIGFFAERFSLPCKMKRGTRPKQ